MRVYQLAEAIADRVWEIVSSWDDLARDLVGKQLIRAADSIGANIAEGTGRFGLQDNERFIYIARGSVNETKHWLRRAYKRKLLTGDQIDLLKPLLDELAPKLKSYANSIGRMILEKQRSTINEQRSTNNEPKPNP
ncbi:MAG: four helix bundle protein [Pyrinomonadaceae bacterium]